ncbi:MAG TPA: hypothetical protein VE715_03635 [Blastocatellia bacterium]|nr:hypothetical protein [Blastocatellia bacterium]
MKFSTKNADRSQARQVRRRGRQAVETVSRDEGATMYIVKRENDILVIDDFKKQVGFDAETGRESNEIVVTILTEGIGKRIG